MHIHEIAGNPTKLSPNLYVVQSGQTIQAVIDSITDAAVDNFYEVRVPPGHETEKYTGKPYITVVEMGEKQLFSNDYPSNRNILISDFEVVDEWTTWGSPTLSISNTEQVRGDYCLRAITTSDTGFKLYKAGSWDFTGYDFSIFAKAVNAKIFYLDFYDNASHGATFYLLNNETIPFSEMFQYQMSKWRPKGGTSSNIDWTNIIQIRIWVVPVTGETATVYLDNLEAIRTYPYPLAILRFDDGYNNCDSNARPVLQSFNYRGILGIITNEIGNGAYLTAKQIQNFDALGWDACSHTHTHLHLKNITNSQVTQELLVSKRILENLGISRGSRFFIVPYGGLSEYTNHALKEIKKYYAISFLNASADGGVLVYGNNLYHVENVSVTSATLSTTLDMITTLSEQNGLIVLTMHHVLPSGGNITPTELTELCQHLKDNGVRVVTASELYDDIIQGGTPTVSSLAASTKIVIEELMTGNLEFEPFEGDIYYLDPGGNHRNFSPSEAFEIGTEIILINTADAAENLIFDPTFTAAGTHDAAAHDTIMTDSGESWVVGQLVGRTINNTPDGSSGVITANTATTVTAVLSGGTSNDWQNGEAYTITPVGLNQTVGQDQRATFVYDGEGWDIVNLYDKTP